MLKGVKGFSEVSLDISPVKGCSDNCGLCPMMHYSPISSGVASRRKWFCRWEGCRLSSDANGLAVRSDTCTWNKVKESYISGKNGLLF